MNARVKVLEDMKTSSETWNSLPAEDPVDRVLSIGLTHDEIAECFLIRVMEMIKDHFNPADAHPLQVLAVFRVFERTQFILEQFISEDTNIHKGTAVMDTVQEDIHKIGKEPCYTTSFDAGHKVIDLDTIRLQGHLDIIMDIAPDIFRCSTLMIPVLSIQGGVVRVVHNKNMLIAIIFGGSPCSQGQVNNISDNGYLSLFAGMIMLFSGLYTRRNRNMAVRHLDFDIWRSYHHLLNIMVLCSSVGHNGS